MNFDWPEAVMQRLRKNMLERDVLAMSTVVGTPSDAGEIEETLRHYRTKEAEAFDTYIPTLLRIPFEREVRWNGEKKCVEVFARITEDVELDVGKGIRLKRVDRLLLARSYRWEYTTIANILHRMHFLTEHILTTKKREYMLGVCGVKHARV